MDFLGPTIVAAVVLAVLVVYRKAAASRINKKLRSKLTERQQAIQGEIDSLGSKLKDASTTIQNGDEALEVALKRLRELDNSGDLSALIADTEDFFKAWRAAKAAAPSRTKPRGPHASG